MNTLFSTVLLSLLTIGMLLLSGCGNSGSDSSDDVTAVTVADPPTIDTATSGDTSASIAFTAPTENGGATITGYEVTCIAGEDPISATGSESPIVVTDLINDTTYSCSVTASNSAGASTESSAVSVTPEASVVTDADFEATDWTEESHSKNVDPNLSEVFNDMTVKRFDFVVTEERWQSMLDDMTATYGEMGQSSTGGPGLISSDEDPIFVPAEVYYNGTQWYRVGIRFKGNSSLQTSWSQGILKLSFKMDFDEFEDDYPQIKNQRFYGFKKFSLKNNFDDKSHLREKVAADVFAKAGLAVSHTAFYRLYVDHGNGPEYFGLYTLVEEVDGTVLDTQFISDDGNLYKPEEGGANFVDGAFAEENFEKKTNEDEADWSDVLALFAALHDDTASTDPATWRANLESVFDVDGFLKYLAVNGIIQNWDTYGKMTHNFYLYNDPETEKLTWIPWDNNEALQDGKLGGALALSFSNIQANAWPLIEKLYADEIYKAQYNSYILEVIANAFEPTITQDLYDSYSALIEPYATTEVDGYTFLDDADDFYNAISELKAHVSSREDAVNAYISGQ
ncbi:MAG: spore coat protein [Gammaproteobacteria bacterium]|nr:spore coat protein [Gammaproteobacteria bacterium]